MDSDLGCIAKCSHVVHIYKMDLVCRKLILAGLFASVVVQLDSRAKLDFRDLIVKRGYSTKVAEDLWKWYDFSEKKGVASF